MKRILYKQDNGVLAVIIPTEEALAVMSIEEIAAKDVPTGKPYKIVDTSEVSTDRTNRSEWTINESELTDGIGE